MTEPFFCCIDNLGDVNPYEYGGAFVMLDLKGISDPELIIYEDETRERIRFAIERGFLVKDEHSNILGVSFNHYNSRYIDRELSDLQSIANFISEDTIEFAQALCDVDVRKRALAWKSVYDYWGADNVGGSVHKFDDKKEARRFCDFMLKQIKEYEAIVA